MKEPLPDKPLDFLGREIKVDYIAYPNFIVSWW